MPTVSLCMIVKNEEAVLARCLDSVRGCVDEIIIADTGSTDATKEIAGHFTNKIYDFVWIDDFAAARNFAFSKASCDFAMWLDADDVLTDEDRRAFIELKNAIPENIDVVMMRYNTGFDEDGRPVFSYYRERLVRRSIDFCWKGRVHEAIVHNGSTMFSDVAVTHRSVKTTYSDRNLRIYMKQEEDGEPFTPRDRFYYGRELYYHKHYEYAEKILEDFIASGRGWVENSIEACKILAYCYLEGSGATLKAFDALMQSFRFDMPRAEICCEIGNLFMRIKNYRLAVFWFEFALQLPGDVRGGGFYSADCHGYLPCIQLCVCFDRLGDLKRAAEYNRMAGTFRPHSAAYLQNLKYFEEN